MRNSLVVATSITCGLPMYNNARRIYRKTGTLQHRMVQRYTNIADPLMLYHSALHRSCINDLQQPFIHQRLTKVTHHINDLHKWYINPPLPTTSTQTAPLLGPPRGLAAQQLPGQQLLRLLPFKTFSFLSQLALRLARSFAYRLTFAALAGIGSEEVYWIAHHFYIYFFGPAIYM